MKDKIIKTIVKLRWIWFLFAVIPFADFLKISPLWWIAFGVQIFGAVLFFIAMLTNKYKYEI